MFALLEKKYEICYKTPYDIINLTFGIFLHYLWKLKVQIFYGCRSKRKEIAFLIGSNFIVHPQILIFPVFKIASVSPC